MKNMIKSKKTTITASMVIAMVVVTAIVISKLMGFSFADNTFVVSNGKYIVTNEKKLTVQYVGASKKTVTSVNIPATVKINGQSYKVTSIKANALKGNIKVKKLTIGKNVETIGKNAFYGCKNLKTVTINTTKLTNSSIKANAFKGLNSKAVVTVPENKLIAYKKILKAKGFTGKKQTVKGKKIEIEDKEEENKEEEVPEVTFDPDHPLPDPEYAVFSIGDITMIGSANLDKMKVTESAEYSTGDIIPFSAKIRMHPDIYGTWGTRKSHGLWIGCVGCGRKFNSAEQLAIHVAMDVDKCTGNSEWPSREQDYTESYWIPDEAICKMSFHITLPEGLSYEEDSIQLYHLDIGIIDSNAYRTEISGQEISVTIDDIKSEPFYSKDITLDRSYTRWPISVLFNAKMNNSTTAINTVKADVSYNYKDVEKTIDFGEYSLYASSLQIKNTDASGNAVSGSKFALYKEKVTYTGNIGKPKFYKIAEGTGIDGLVSFKGISEGRYKLKQAVPNGYKPMSDIIFNVSMTANDGTITSLVVKDDFGESLPWEIDTMNGIISATIVNK